MFVAFYFRNRKRRRIARVERLVLATQVLMPTMKMMVRIYAKAWRGHAH